MRLVFVRHGPKLEDPKITEDADRPLDPAYVERARALSAKLAERGLRPRFIASSAHRHARETAEALRATRTRLIVPVTALTPGTPESEFNFAAIARDLAAAGVNLQICDVLMLVGHESRLSQLAMRVLGRPAERLEPLEALVVDVHASAEGRFRAGEGVEK